MILEYKGKTPVLGKNVFIAPTASVIGDVQIGDNSSVWYGAVVRGDLAAVRIGSNSNIQDNCTVHTDEGKPAIIGNYVTVGHNAVVHGCTVEDRCLIGIGAVLLNASRIRTGSVVAAGSVVKEGQTIGPYHLVTGAPAALKKELSAEISGQLEYPATVYLELSEAHRAILKGMV